MMRYPLVLSVIICSLLWGGGEAFVVQREQHQHRRHLASPLCSVPRRDFVNTGIGGILLSGGSGSTWGPGGAANAASPSSDGLVADLPMIRLRLPKSGLGREYVAIKLKIAGQGPFDFMVDSGLTTELITPHLQQVLHIGAGQDFRGGIGAGGSAMSQSIVNLDGASLCCGDFAASKDELTLPSLHAVITDFPQEHIDPSHDPVEGMLGMEVLSMFDVDFDFPKGRLRLYQPGTAAASASASGMCEIAAIVINETGLIGIRLLSTTSKQPLLAFLDCGSPFSTINWDAADLLGLPPKTDPMYKKGPAVAAIGVDGRLLDLPLVKQELTFAGDVKVDPASGRPVGFESPPPQWKPWKPVPVAVGDLPAFSQMLGDGRTPFKGPAALIGLDILAQRRVILEAGKQGSGRKRRVFVDPK